MAIFTSLLILTLTSLASLNQATSEQKSLPVTRNYYLKTINTIPNTIEQSARIRRHHERDFAPKLIHQPHSVSVESGKPQTIECPVEAQPESEIRWFKDGQLLESEPAHLEQTGSELMFFQINESDSGDYYCQATNYLGSTTSDQFKLHVQSTVRDARIRIEPQRLELSPNQWAEFACILPPATSSGAYSSRQISWRRNGRKIDAQVVWWQQQQQLPGQETGARDIARDRSSMAAKYMAEQTSRKEFRLRIKPISYYEDNNSTFSCVFEGDSSELGPSEQSDGSETGSGQLPRESSNDALLLVVKQQNDVLVASTTQPTANNEGPIRIDVNMGPPPIDQLANYTNSTTNEGGSMVTGQKTSRRLGSLSETLADLYEIAKPTLIVFAIMCLVAMVVLLNFVFWRRPCTSSTSRYMKHNQQSFLGVPGASSGNSSSGCSSNVTSSCSSGSGTGVAGLMAECADPMLSSLLSRTLSGPSFVATKNNTKFKPYRPGQSRKIGQAQVANNEFISNPHDGDYLDAATYFSVVTGNDNGGNFYHQQQQQQQQQVPQPQPQLANLYNQSLAAREQARSLLQASEHMRSLSNLMQTNGNNGKTKSNQQRAHQIAGANNGSHLNLPLSFSFDRQQQLDANQLLSQHGNMWQQQQQHHRQTNENYQLVSCSSISPNSSSNGSDHNNKQARNVTLTSNHYLTIDDSHLNNDDNNEICDEEQRYEELDGQRNQPQRCSFSSRTSSNQSRQRQIMNGSSFRTGIKRSSLNENAQSTKQRNSQQLNDQLSPYAVSSIWNANNNNNNFHSQPPLPPPPPPPQPQPQPVAASEAMRALNEQFDINQLMLMADEQEDNSNIEANPASEDSQSNEHLLSCLPFNPPPPPPPPPVPSQANTKGLEKKLDRSQQNRKSGNKKSQK